MDIFDPDLWHQPSADAHLLQLHGNNPDSQTSFAIVSSNKKNICSTYKWYLGKDGYPFAFINKARVPLHRFIWYLNSGSYYNKKINNDFKIEKLYVDHINRNKLDATDTNLRLATAAENSYNKSISSKLSKSTIIDPSTNKPLHHIKLKKSGYEINISKGGKVHKINKISNLEEAKQIYNMMAVELFDDFAVLY